jgi:hypothetical protein
LEKYLKLYELTKETNGNNFLAVFVNFLIGKLQHFKFYPYDATVLQRVHFLGLKGGGAV